MMKPLLLGMLLIAGVAAGQRDGKPAMFSSDLVAWSTVPLPQPLPQIVGTNELLFEESSIAEPEVSFSGRITGQGGEYILRISESTSYWLDHPEVARLYEGMQVLVLGALDPSGTSIRIRKVVQHF